MKTQSLILAVTLYGATAFAQYQNFYCNITGTNVNAGTTTNATPTVSGTGGNWTNATQTYRFSGATDLSAVTNGMFASVYPDGGTVAVFIGRITAVNDANDFITVSNQTSSGTAPSDGTGNRSIRVEGAWFGPRSVNGYSEPFPINFANGNLTNTAQNPPVIWLKGDRLYTVGSNIVNSMLHTRLFAYTNQPGDLGQATIYGATNLGTLFYTLMRQTGAGWHFKNIIWRGGGTNATGSIHTNMVETTAVGIMERCAFYDAWETGWNSTGAGTLGESCFAWNCNVNAASLKGGFATSVSTTYINCIAAGSLSKPPGDGNSGFAIAGDNTVPMWYINCIAALNGGSGWDIQSSRCNVNLLNCVSFHTGLNGISASVTVITNLSQINAYNCIFVGNTNYAMRGFSGQVQNFWWGPRFFNCAFFNNLNNITNTYASNILGNITMTTTPFIDSANGYFNLTNTATGGALAINTGYSPFLQTTGITSTTTSYIDLGPAQVTNSATGGGIETRIIRR